MLLRCSSQKLAEALGAAKVPTPLLDEKDALMKLDRNGIVIATQDGGVLYWHVDADARRSA